MVSRAHKKASRATKRDHKSNESALKSDQTIFNKVEELEKIASDLRKDVEIKWLKLSNSVHLLKTEVMYCQIFIFYPIPNNWILLFRYLLIYYFIYCLICCVI